VLVGDYEVRNMNQLMLVEFILCTIPLIFAFFFLKDGPPTAPSHSTKLKQMQGSSKSGKNSSTVHRKLFNTQETTDEESHDLLATSNQQNIPTSTTTSTAGAATATATTTIATSTTTITTTRDSNGEFSHSCSNVSSAAKQRLKHVVESGEGKGEGEDDIFHTRGHVWEEVYALASNWNFVLLSCAFFIGVGFFNSVMTLLNQIVQPFGYTNDDAGTFGAVFIICGLVGAGIMGKILEITKAYITVLRVGICIAGASTILCFSMLFSNNFWPLTICFGLLGMSVLPLLPAMLENCAECTYPIPEELSAGILYSGCNLAGLAFVFALQYLLALKPFGPPPFLPSSFFIFGMLILAGMFCFLYNGEYKRHQRELLHHRKDSDDNANTNDNAETHKDIHSMYQAPSISSSASSTHHISRSREKASTSSSKDSNIVLIGSQEELEQHSQSRSENHTTGESASIWNVR
jgi:hypothetical protein